MIKYTKKVKKLISKFDHFKLKQIPRGKNALSKLAHLNVMSSNQSFLHDNLLNPSINQEETMPIKQLPL